MQPTAQKSLYALGNNHGKCSGNNLNDKLFCKGEFLAINLNGDRLVEGHYCMFKVTLLNDAGVDVFTSSCQAKQSQQVRNDRHFSVVADGKKAIVRLRMRTDLKAAALRRANLEGHDKRLKINVLLAIKRDGARVTLATCSHKLET